MIPDQQQLLIKKAQDGGREALSQLWDKITPKLFGYLINTLKNRQLAEDLLQTTWLKAIAALPKFQDRGNGMEAWLFAIARNECRQHWRKGEREVPLDNSAYDVPDTRKEGTEQQILVEQLLNKLPEDDRELLRLRYIADLPITDIARILNINFVAVRVRLHRALKRARAAYNPQTYEQA